MATPVCFAWWKTFLKELLDLWTACSILAYKGLEDLWLESEEERIA